MYICSWSCLKYVNFQIKKRNTVINMISYKMNLVYSSLLGTYKEKKKRILGFIWPYLSISKLWFNRRYFIQLWWNKNVVIYLELYGYNDCFHCIFSFSVCKSLFSYFECFKVAYVKLTLVFPCKELYLKPCQTYSIDGGPDSRYPHSIIIVFFKCFKKSNSEDDTGKERASQ